MSEKVIIAIVSALAGILTTFLLQYLIPLSIERRRERIGLLRALRKNSVPLMSASYQLYRRLRNILEEENYIALHPSWDERPPEKKSYWPMEHRYFVESTQYLFGVLFASVERYNLDIVYLPQSSQKDFHKKIRNFQRTLYDVSLNENHLPDYQVYLLEQKAMGEALLSNEVNGRFVMGILQFRQKLEKDAEFRQTFFPIERLIINIKPDAPEERNFRFERLSIFNKRLAEFYFSLANHTHGDLYNLPDKIRIRGDYREKR